MHEKEKQAMVDRLKRIEGQIRGLQRLVEEEASCQDILMQASAALAAIKKVSALVIQTHLEKCLERSKKKSEKKQDESLQELKEVLSRYMNLV